MFEGLLDYALGVGGGVSAVGLGGLAAYMKFELKKVTNTIIEGSEDIKHERAVRTFESAFKTATRCLGYEIRRIQNDLTLRGKPLDVSYRFNAVWLNEWKEMLRSVSGATFKGRPLELYVYSALNDWNSKKDFLLQCLHEQMQNPNIGGGKVENLEKELSSFKHSLEYGSENWLNKGLLHQEEPKPKKSLKSILEKDNEKEEIDLNE